MSTSRGKRLPLRLDGNGSATVNVTGDGTAFQPSSPEFVLLNSQFADARVLNAQLRSRLADAATAVDLGAHDDDADDDDADDDSVSEAGDQLDSDSTGDAIPHRPAPLPLNSRTPTPPTGCASIPAVPLPIRDRDPSLSSSAPLRNEPIPFNAASTPNTFASATTTDVSTSTSSPATKAGRLLIVSNRLPVSMSVKTVSNPRSSSSSSSTTTMREISFSPSSGGLVSALRGCEMEMLWFGWPGCEVENSSEREIVRSKLSSQGCVPVFLPSELIDLYYNGFCNNILWPLFHYIPLPIESLTSGDQQFSSYEKCNQLFAKTILEVYEDGDVVWVHDYHLMLLPMILRKMKSDMKVGFFLHTPFPSSEIYRGLPSRKELLLGVLCANLIGFHTHDYGRHFQSACTRILGANCSGDRIKFKGQIAEVGTFPIGIDPQKFIDTLKTGPVQSLKRELKQKFNGKKVILGIDRLDYIKGIGQKLYGLERFFEKHPEWIGRVVLVQIAVPSRTDVPEYQRLRSSTHELVGRLNGRFGSLDSVPVHYLDQSIPFDMMCALYRISNSMIITSVRDGMNLVAYEYIACQGQEDEPDGDGCLILSEFAGAAQSLGAGAIQVNPWNINETAEAIYQALTMNSKERTERMRYLLNHVMTHTSRAWARSFVSTLNSLPQLQSAVDLSDDGITPRASSIIPLDIDTVMGTFAQSKHRVIITSLAAIVAKARKASRFAAGLKPDVSTELEGLEQCLEEGLDEVGLHFQRDPDLETMKMVVRSLSVDPNTTFIILTSRSRQWCDELFGDIPEIWLCAENGLYVRRGTNPNINLNQSNPIPSFDSNSMNAESSVAGPAPAPSAPISNSLLNLNSDFNPNSSSSPTWQCMYDDVPLDWKDGVRKIFDYFAHRTPNSYILEESSHMSWHYHDADPTHAKQQANDLISHLTGGPLSNTSTELVDSHQMVQVTPVGVTPARAVKWILNHLHHRRNKLLKAESAAFEGQQAETPPASGYGSVGTDEDDKNSSGKSKSEEIDDDKSNYVALGASVSRRKSFSTLTSFITSTDAKHRTPVDFVLCIGKFLERDVDLFTVLNGWSDQHQISLSAFPSTASTPTAGSRRMSSIATTPASSNAPSLASGVSSGSGHGPSSRTFIFPPPFQSEAASRSSSGASDPVSDIGSSHLTNIFSPSPQSFGSTMGERVLSRSNMNPNDLFGPPLRSSTGSSSSSMPPHLLSQGRYGLPHLSLDSLSVSTAATLPSPSPFGLNDSNPAVSPPTACGTPSQSTHPNNNTSGSISGSSSSSASAPLIFTVSIGGGPSKARYFLDDSEAAYALILRLGEAIQEKRMESTKLQQDVSESMETGKEKDREKEMAKDTDKADEISSGFERLEKRGSEKSSKLQM